MVTNAFSGVLTMLACVAVGIVVGKLGYIDEEMEVKISKFTLHFSVPFLLFISCQNYISRELIAELGFTLIAPLFIILAGYALGMLAAKLFRVPRHNRGLFLIMFSMSNTIFIGLPVCVAIFGEQSLPLIAAYFPYNTILFWTLGAIGLAADGGQKFKPGIKTLKQLFSPPLIGALLGSAFALAGIQLPGFLTEAMRYMGNLTTPLALTLAGCTLSRMGRGVLKMTREGALTLVGRFFVSPALSLLFCTLMGAPALVTQVYTMESAMPVMSQSMLLARSHNANHEMAAQMITFTTILGLIYVPLLTFILSKVT